MHWSTPTTGTVNDQNSRRFFGLRHVFQQVWPDRPGAGGVVKKLDPNPHSMKSRGMLCARGNAGIKQLYDPDRLKYPLLRKGERGEGKWQRLTWDQAMTCCRADGTSAKIHPLRILFMAGTDLQSTFVHRLAAVYGSYNVISHESNCLLSRNRAFLDTYGVVPMADVLN